MLPFSRQKVYAYRKWCTYHSVYQVTISLAISLTCIADRQQPAQSIALQVREY